MRRFFSPKGDRFGLNLAFTGTRVTANLTASSTDTFHLPTPFRRCAVERLSCSVDTVPVNAAANTCIVYKYDASADAAVALTAAFDLEALVTKEVSQIPLLSTLTDAQRMLDEGDALYVVTTQGGAQNTQPTNLCFSAELAITE